MTRSSDTSSATVQNTRRSKKVKFANPGPLGLCAFALTTFVLSLVNARADNVNTPNVIVGLSFAYGGFAQMIAGVQEFVVGNTFGSTAFTSYGAFWMSYGYILVPNSGILAAYKNSSELENALGFYLLGWTIQRLVDQSCSLPP